MQSGRQDTAAGRADRRDRLQCFADRIRPDQSVPQQVPGHRERLGLVPRPVREYVAQRSSMPDRVAPARHRLSRPQITDHVTGDVGGGPSPRTATAHSSRRAQLR